MIENFSIGNLAIEKIVTPISIAIFSIQNQMIAIAKIFSNDSETSFQSRNSEFVFFTDNSATYSETFLRRTILLEFVYITEIQAKFHCIILNLIQSV